ncbi:transglycosylase family protein [Streptomyces sp. NPDC051907]|uniref:transglycosylase family protein n=1 Tax=Streptomyces sp. NPDC051907 TaxID=3155284 RepID=UPI0034482892
MAATGRHRRYQPSRINRASLTVTAGGAGIALPLVGAGTGHAASVDVWEKVAACESTSNWRINTGNGYFGGLQFSQSTWEAYGGRQFAPRADLASKDQQIAIAEKVLKGQGPKAWPHCSTKAGLARGGDAPDIAPAKGKESKGKDSKAKGSKGQESKDRQQTKPRTPAKATSPTTVPTQREGYTVARGDSLSKIAKAERVTGGWQRLYDENRTVVGGDPDVIHPGQRLILRMEAPAKAKERPKAQQPKAAPKAQAKSQQPKAESRQAAKPAQRGGLSSPVDARPSTAYRQAGSSWARGYHTGVDFPVPTGTSVKAVASGKVVSAGWGGAYGYEIVIRHADGRYSQYGHLSALTVREGQQVSGGQRIARSGSTGNSTGPHLHFEVRTGPGYGSDIDPLAYLRSGGVSV